MERPFSSEYQKPVKLNSYKFFSSVTDYQILAEILKSQAAAVYQ